MNFPKTRLGNIADFNNGVNFNQTSYKQGVKLIGVSDFGERFSPNIDSLAEIDKNVVADNALLKNGDIVFVRSNGNKALVGRCMLIKEVEQPVTFSGFCIRARFKNLDQLAPEFFAYYFKSQYFRKSISGSSVGTNIQNLNQSILKNTVVPLPDFYVQKRISKILSSYDDLIENNQKQIKLLEEAAQRLYKEWFVDLRFPGYEQSKIVDGLPEGWRNIVIGDLNCRLESGSRPKGGIDNSLVEGIPSIGAENVLGLGKYNYALEKLVSNDFFSNMKKGKIIDKDILIYKDGAYIGKTSLFQDSFPYKNASVNEHVFLLHTDNEMFQYYLFFTLYQSEYYMKMQKLNKNSAQPGINAKALLSLDLMLPSPEIIGGFNQLVTPFVQQIFNKAKQNHKLEQARDRLLPKLMNGEIEV